LIRFLNVLERRAKLYGLDLERSVVGGMLPTAEMLAALFGEPYSETIDVEGEEEHARRAAGARPWLWRPTSGPTL
jgi:hypothetical protein